MKKLLFKKTKIDKKTLCLSLGVKAGVGTIIGTASSIFIGGCGTILWICLFTIFTCPIIYYESLLGSKYKEKTKTNTLSGPYFYIKKGLNKKYLAIITNIIFILTYSFLFLMIQTNTISEIIKLNIKSNFFNIIILIIIFLILLLIIFFNINNILKLLNKIVPFMCLFFILISSYIIIKNNNLIIPIIKNIISSAFSIRGITVGVIIGIKRSVFLSELLIGTTSFSSSVSLQNNDATAKTQVIASLFLSFVMCVLTSFLILIYLYSNKQVNLNYNELLNNVFIYHLGTIGGYILLVLILLLSFTTIISGYYIGLSNIKYLTKSTLIISLFKLFVLLFVMSGIYIDTSLIWYLLDIMMLVLIIINTIALKLLSRREKYDR